MFGFGSKQEQIDNLRMRVTYLEKKFEELEGQLKKVDAAVQERGSPSTSAYMKWGFDARGPVKYTAIEGVNALLNHLDLTIYRKPAQDSRIELIKKEALGDPFLQGRGSD